MKIVSFDQFINMKKGTVFSFYEPYVFDGISIKGDSINNNRDFYYQDLVGNIFCGSSGSFFDGCKLAQDKGISLELDFNAEQRDGIFDYARFFAVYSAEEVSELVKCLLNREQG